ncbi:hypothetical protein Hanom_Chr12g01088431 [Helianthus anomalus]
MSVRLCHLHRVVDHYNGTSLEPMRLHATCLTPSTGSNHRQPCQPHATGHTSATMCSRTCSRHQAYQNHLSSTASIILRNKDERFFSDMRRK